MNQEELDKLSEEFKYNKVNCSTTNLQIELTDKFIANIEAMGGTVLQEEMSTSISAYFNKFGFLIARCWYMTVIFPPKESSKYLPHMKEDYE